MAKSHIAYYYSYNMVFFLADFFTFQQLGGFPNPILSILALVVLMLEYAVSKGLKK